MAAKRFYLIARRERHKNRRKLMTALKKNGYTESDVIRIVDGAAGRTHSGKEAAAKEILTMLAAGMDKQDIFDRLEASGKHKYDYVVK